MSAIAYYNVSIAKDVSKCIPLTIVEHGWLYLK